MRKFKIAIVIGTRPDAIKMAPLIARFQDASDDFSPKIIATGQHRELLEQVLSLFAITPYEHFNIMEDKQTLFRSLARILNKMAELYQKIPFDLVLVQGDTTTCLAAALAAYYNKISIGHIEAGLRTSQRYNPFPEETNRRLTDHLADLHFAPTLIAKHHLLNEGISPSAIFITGNSGIDALKKVLPQIPPYPPLELKVKERLIFLTIHRRENWGTPTRKILQGIKMVLKTSENLRVFFPVHPNPELKRVVKEEIGTNPRVMLSSPVDYLTALWIMQYSYLILTDSGGIQEEAPTLKKPVLVLREYTERPELINEGGGILVGSNPDLIYKWVTRLIHDKSIYHKMLLPQNPFGDGRASEKIVNIVRKYLKGK